MAGTHMLITIATLPEIFRTLTASVRLFTGVNPLMVLQCIGPIETFTALFATVSTFTAMYQPMLIEYRSGKKSFATNQTMIRTFARVTLSDVIVKIRPNCKATITVWFFAGKRFDTCGGESKSVIRQSILRFEHTDLCGSANAATNDWTVYTICHKSHTNTDDTLNWTLSLVSLVACGIVADVPMRPLPFRPANHTNRTPPPCDRFAYSAAEINAILCIDVRTVVPLIRISPYTHCTQTDGVN